MKKHRKYTQLFDLMDHVMSEQLGYLFNEEIKTEDYVVWVETQLTDEEVDDMSTLIINPQKLNETEKNDIKNMLLKKWEEFKKKKRLYNQNRNDK
jgi:hypothetical protein